LKVFAIVPVKNFESGKSRLASLLTVEERVKLSELFLDYTLNTLTNTSAISNVVVVSSDKRAEGIAKIHNVKFLQEKKNQGVNAAVALADVYISEYAVDATIVIPQDLPLLLPEDIERICTSAQEHEKCLVICPSLRFDGSNALLRRPPLLISTHYDNDSYNVHIKKAKASDAIIKIIKTKRIMTDIDTVEDVINLIKINSRNKDNINKAVGFLTSKIKKFNLFL
jgi:2-phospho-L-lactate/phosphoenolpyruvate guanylyltransferase